MQRRSLPEVKHEMSHYSLINPLHTVPSANISSVSSPRYAPCREMSPCVCVCLSPSPPLPLDFHGNCHSPPFPQVHGGLEEIILLIKLWKRVQKL